MFAGRCLYTSHTPLHRAPQPPIHRSLNTHIKYNPFRYPEGAPRVREQIADEVSTGKFPELPAKLREHHTVKSLAHYYQKDEIPGVVYGLGKAPVLITVPYRYIRSHADRDVFADGTWEKKYLMSIENNDPELVAVTGGKICPETRRAMHVSFRLMRNIDQRPGPKKKPREVFFNIPKQALLRAKKREAKKQNKVEKDATKQAVADALKAK